MTDDYEQRLRKVLASAREVDEASTRAYTESEADPISHEHKMLGSMMAMNAGRVLGLTEALNLLLPDDRQEELRVALTTEDPT
jgi:hypothetical protein